MAGAAGARQGVNPKIAAWREGRGKRGYGHGRLRPAGADEIDARALERDLRDGVRGEVRFDAGSRAIYSHDSSNYRQDPIGVVVPATTDDVVAAVAACRRHGAPVLPRGAATSLSGETINRAVVIDISKRLRAIVEIDAERKLARVQPGVVRDQLSDLTEERFNLTFAPDTSTHEYATFGGMIGNNSCGVHSVMAGRTSDNVEELEVLTYDGERLRVGPTSEDELEGISAAGGRRGEIYRRMRELRDRHAEEIRRRFPDIPRRVSGYNLDELLPENGFNVARLLVGSEGTLATVLEATVRLVHSPPGRSLLVLGYSDIFRAADHIPEILSYDPVGLEGIDQRLIDDMQAKRMHPAEIELLPEGEGWLLVEFGADTMEESDARARECMEALSKDSNPPSMKRFDDPPDEEKIWQIREAGLGATAYVPGEGDHWPGWEDAAVPPQRLGEYLREFRQLLERHDYHAALYGHFGDGCVHCRIDFDLRSAEGLRRWRRFLDEAADLVIGYGGSLSGEHGDGQQRAELLPKMYGEEITGAMRELKAIWDPDNRMNPHKVVDPYPIVSNLKLGADYAPPSVATHFAYPEDDGDFARATLRCVGVGKCRETDSGTMCPSYMATREEMHTTRGRARILYEMLEGDVVTDGFRSEEVHEALDLCLSCKGCKTDCPVNVDMATYKAEFLSRHYKRRLRPPEAYTMGLIMLHARLANRMPRLTNRLLATPGLGRAIKRLGGISPKRKMPPFADQDFRSWFSRRAAANPDADPVILFPDTFNNYLHPEPIKAAVEVLELSGHRVVVPEQALCCGRPLYDYGMLDLAKLFWRRTLSVLRDEIRGGAKVVGLEPSCVAAFRDELPNLMSDDFDARRLSNQVLTLAEFLQQEAPGWEPPRLERRAVVHVHCHQEADMGSSAEEELYRRMGLNFEVLDSGCCGMAGSFGFEHGHRDISVKIAEGRLLPLIRDAGPETLLIADGFSCKSQIEELSDRRALHTAQVLKMALDHGPIGVAGTHPERHYPDVVLNGGRSRGVAAGAVAAGVAAIGAGVVRAKRRGG